MGANDVVVVVPQVQLNRRARRAAEKVHLRYKQDLKFRLLTEVMQSDAPDEKCVLVNAPIDVLSQIFFYMDASDLLKVYKCGQRMLNYHLCYGAWREFNAHIILPAYSHNNHGVKWRWPTKLLSQLPCLKRISIKIDYLCAYDEWSIPFCLTVNDLEELAHSGPIEHFSLEIQNVARGWSDREVIQNGMKIGMVGFEDNFNFAKAMPHLSYLKWHYLSINLGHHNLSTMPSTLHTLIVSKLADDVSWKEHIPKSITKLNVAGNPLDWKKCCGLSEMSSLQDLSIFIDRDFNCENFAQLPSSITSLKLVTWAITTMNLSYLPSSIVHLVVHGDLYLSDCSTLPRSLQSLHVERLRKFHGDNQCHLLSQLPAMLTRLTFKTSFSHPDFASSAVLVTDDILAALPRTLEYFAFNANCYITERGILNLLPPLVNRTPFLSLLSNFVLYATNHPDEFVKDDPIASTMM